MDENFYAPWKEYKDSVYEIVVTEGVINLSTYAFIHHTHLKKVTLPEGLKTIGVYAFKDCPELTEINFPDTLEVIGDFAFYGDSLLSSVTLPESLTTISSYAFKDCLNLSEIHFKGSIEQWADIDKGGFWDSNAGSSTAKGTYSLYCDKDSQEIYIGAKEKYTVGDGFEAEVYVRSDDGSYISERYTYEGYDSTKTGMQIVTVYYGNYSKTFEIIVEKEVIEGNILRVRFDHIKENYEYGEDFYAEITIETDVNIYHNVSDYVVEGFDKYHPGEQIVTVMFGDYSHTVTVWVNDPETEPDPEPDEPDPEPETTVTVAIENVQTEYEYGEDFYAEVWLHYSDGSSEMSGDYLIEGFDSYTPGKQTVDVIYGDYRESFVVTVYEAPAPEPEESPVISVSKPNAMPGETVDVVVSISGNTGFSNLGLEIEYSDALKLINVSANIDVDAQFTPAQTLDVYPFNFSFDNEAGSAFNGDLVTLTFEVAEDAQAGEHFVNVNYYDGRDDNYIDGEDVNYDVDENPLNLCYEDGFVCVYTHIPGDIDGNGVVNNLDATYLLRYLSGWKVEGINETALDTTGDGRINSKDGTRLLRHLANWDVDIH